MNKNENHYYVEQGEDGKYRGTRGGADRAGYVADTQTEVVQEIQKAHPDAPIHIERVKNTSVGGRDQWR